MSGTPLPRRISSDPVSGGRIVNNFFTASRARTTFGTRRACAEPGLDAWYLRTCSQGGLSGCSVCPSSSSSAECPKVLKSTRRMPQLLSFASRDSTSSFWASSRSYCSIVRSWKSSNLHSDNESVDSDRCRGSAQRTLLETYSHRVFQPTWESRG